LDVAIPTLRAPQRAPLDRRERRCEAPVAGGARMLWSTDWAWGLPLLVLTVVAHVFAMVQLSEAVVSLAGPANGQRREFRFTSAVALTALGAACLHGVEAGLWAVVYVAVGAMPDMRDAMLYSLGAITSYGHEAFYLEDHWRLLGAIEAVNGLILFGLTTAFLFGAIQQVSPIRARRIHDSKD
jgi:hypothetical protein